MRLSISMSLLLVASLCAVRANAAVVYRINAGGPDYTDPDGHLWRSDSALGYFNIGESYAVDSGVEIEGTDLDPLFRSHRYDSSLANPEMIYSFPVDPGNYSVSLYFADTYWGFEGRRRFGVDIEGVPVLVDYDIVGLTGGKDVADIQQFVTQVPDGDPMLTIQFNHGSIDHPLICAILIESIPPAPIILNGESISMSVLKDSTCVDSGNQLRLEAVDPDSDTATLQWMVTSGPSHGSVSFLGGTEIGSDAIVCYEPAAGQTQPDAFTIGVTDGDVGNLDEIDVSVALDDIQAPDLTCPADITLDADAAITPDETGMATATDDFGAAPTITASDTVVSGVCPVAIELRRTWKARDAAGNVATCVQVVSILDHDTDGDGTVDCADIAPDDAGVGGSDNGNSNTNTNTNVNDNGGDDQTDNDTGVDNSNGNDNSPGNANDNGDGNVIIDPATGQPVPTQECCGGGFPAMIPFMLLGWRYRRRSKRGRRS